MDNEKDINKQLTPFEQASKSSPVRNALEVIGLYLVLGFLWIFFSDMALKFLVQDSARVEELQLVKGLFYVVFTGFIFYIIIKKRMDIYFNTMNHLNVTLTELKVTHANLQTVEHELEQIAYYDKLTGLYTRNMLIKTIDEHIDQHPNDLLGLVYIDIDDFSTINEIKGHTIGDQLILLVAEELKKITGNTQAIGHLGGDGFLILLKGYLNKAQMLDIVQKNAIKLRRSFILDHEEFFITVSIGVCTYPEDGRTTQMLLSNVDLALGKAKALGKNQLVVYNEKYHTDMKNQIEISNLLYQGFKVYYQPIVNSKTQIANIVEALIRWHNASKGNIPPLDFIGIAEKTGHIKELTYFVIRESIHQINQWDREGIDLVVSINLSARVLNDPHFLMDIQEIINQHQGNPEKLILEITESAIITHIDESITTLLALKNLGFKIALDDFGTGYSSLTYLQRLPIDIMKIDRSFIRNIKTKDQVLPLLKFMINVAHELNLQVVCEGIEEAHEKEATIKHGSDYLQGYYYSRPNTADQLDKHLLQKKAQ